MPRGPAGIRGHAGLSAAPGSAVRRLVIPTPVGPAHAYVEGGRDTATGRPLLVLGHGAGGGIDTLDLHAARDAALLAGWAVARVEQPYRVRGRRVAEAAPRLDVAWGAVCTALQGELSPSALVTGGRSSGGRVACRTATQVGAGGVLCLAFPLQPPRRGPRVVPSRAGELAHPTVPRLVVQGSRDAFGVPVAGPALDVHVVAGADHSFVVRRADGRSAVQVRTELRDVVGAWLRALAG